MSTTIIARPEGINESNLARVIKEESCKTLASHHYALIAKVRDREKLNRFFGESVREVEEYAKVNLNETTYAFVGATLGSLERDLKSLFLTRRGLKLKGIEPIALYSVERESGFTERVRRY